MLQVGLPMQLHTYIVVQDFMSDLHGISPALYQNLILSEVYMYICTVHLDIYLHVKNHWKIYLKQSCML